MPLIGIVSRVAGFFSESTLEQIRAASDIVDVIGAYVPLKKAGANFTALCPFHKEKSPSFNVNPSRQIFHCFGCHKGGDVFTFVKDYENISFVEAVKRLADRAKIPLETEKDGAGAQTRHLKDTLLQIHEQITQRWQAALANDAAGQIARDYLAKRGVSAEAVKLFRLGYAPDAWDDAVNWGKSKGFEIADMEKAGLVIRKDETNRYYDRFRGRLMFPICDEQGRVIGFSGRVLIGDEKSGKYVNSPETPIFTKSKVLYGLDKAKRSILDAGCVVVCEGQLDTISCHMRGVSHVVAPQGTALTAQHVRTLQRYTNDIILCFDGDSAGRKAAARGYDEMLSLGVPFRIAEIPPPEDPDSFLKKFGRTAFFELIVNSKDFFEWYLDYLIGLNDIKTDRGRLAVINGMSVAVTNTKLKVFTDTYAFKTASRLGIKPDDVLIQFIGRRQERPQHKTEDSDVAKSVSVEPSMAPTLLEAWMLKILLVHEEFVPWALEHFAPEWIEHPTIRAIVEWRFRAATEGNWHGVAAMLDAFESDVAKQFITQSATNEKPIPNPAVQIADVAARLRNFHIDAHRVTLRQQVQNPELDDAARAALLREDHELRVLKQVPIPPPR